MYKYEFIQEFYKEGAVRYCIENDKIHRDPYLDCQLQIERDSFRSNSITLLPAFALLIITGLIHFLMSGVARYEMLLYHSRKPRSKISMTSFGDVYGSVVTVGSVVQGGIHFSAGGDGDLDRAFVKLAEKVAEAKNGSADIAFTALASECKNENPDKEGMKQYWERLLKIVPAIKDSTDIVKTITEIFNPGQHVGF